MTSKEERVSETKGRASDRRREGDSREPSSDKAQGRAETWRLALKGQLKNGGGDCSQLGHEIAGDSSCKLRQGKGEHGDGEGYVPQSGHSVG